MSKTWLSTALMFGAALGCAKPTHHSSLITHHSSLITQPSFRVCADPNNLPYSNIHEQGFENKIASLIARDFNARVQYTWLPQRMGFVRNTLKRGDCDVIIGVPSNYEQAAPTAPYYRSSYVFVTRKGRTI